MSARALPNLVERVQKRRRERGEDEQKRRNRRGRFQTRRETKEPAETHETQHEIITRCIHSLRRLVSRPAHVQKPSLPISHFSFRSASALIFATRRKKKTNSRARTREYARAKQKRKMSFHIRTELVKTNSIAYLF